MNSIVSVCVPIFNGERYLEECLDSIAGQTYTDIEVLLVDDKSTDNSLAIAQRYAARDHRFSVHCNPQNLGLVGNWNRCVELARGQWIKFVFQDDYILPDCLAILLQAATSGAQLIACNRAFIFGEGISNETRKYFLRNKEFVDHLYANRLTLTGKEYRELVLDNIFLNRRGDIGLNMVGEPTAVLLNRKVFDHFGWFDARLIQSCDWEYWTRVAVRDGIAFVPDELAVFRVHQHATSAQNHLVRQYRTRALDNLVVFHKFARDPEYTLLREAAGGRKPPLNIERLLRNKANQAHRIAERMKSRRRDLSCVREWEQFVSAYPDLAIHPMDYLYWRLRKLFRLV